MQQRPSHYRRSVKRDLTPRQREVLALIARGYTNGEIAEELGITLDGAKFHVTEILERLEVPNREAAAELWRRERSPFARMRSLAGLPLGLRVLAGGATLAGLAAAGIAAMSLIGTAERKADTPPSLEQIVEAIRRPGEVFHTEMELQQDDGTSGTYNLWYSSDEGAARGESKLSGSGQPQITIVSDDRQASYNAEGDLFSESPPEPRAKGMPDGAIAFVPQISIFARSDSYTFSGEDTLSGKPVFRFDAIEVRTKEKAYEQVPGTTLRYSVYLSTSTLLPAEIRATVQAPGEAERPLSFPTIRKTEFVARSSLPADFFDRGVLASKKWDIPRMLATASQRPYATFWLGARLEIPWTGAGGEHWDHQEVVLVSALGLPGASGSDISDIVVVGYGPPSGSQLALVNVLSGPESSFEPIPQPLFDMMQSAGHVKPLPSGKGYTYVQYTARAQCSLTQAQTDPACRMPATNYGAVVELERTLVHIRSTPILNSASENAKDTNPFSSEEAILGLVARLQRLP